MADRPHGYARYRLNGCRCGVCKGAVRTYNRKQVIDRANGRPATVDAEPARQHVLALRAEGMGLRQIAAAAGLNRKVLNTLLNGRSDRGDPPSARLRFKSAEAILAVRAPTVETLRDKTLVPAFGLHRRIQALVACGWSQAKLAERLGVTRSNFGTFMKQDDATAATARRVHALYRELQDLTPSEDTHRDRIAASRARRYAAEHDWFPPIAWDDDTIDDPAAHPNMTGYDEATVRDLMAGLHAEAGLVDIEEAVRRGRPVRVLAGQVGINYNTLYGRLRAKAAA